MFLKQYKLFLDLKDLCQFERYVCRLSLTSLCVEGMMSKLNNYVHLIIIKMIVSDPTSMHETEGKHIACDGFLQI